MSAGDLFIGLPEIFITPDVLLAPVPRQFCIGVLDEFAKQELELLGFFITELGQCAHFCGFGECQPLNDQGSPGLAQVQTERLLTLLQRNQQASGNPGLQIFRLQVLADKLQRLVQLRQRPVFPYAEQDQQLEIWFGPYGE